MFLAWKYIFILLLNGFTHKKVDIHFINMNFEYELSNLLYQNNLVFFV